MSAGCNRKNPLSRSGTNQSARLLKALDPDSIHIDERDSADLILFSQRLSRHIKYYDPDNVYDAANPGDYNWLPFFAGDISAVLAGILKLPYGSFLNIRHGLDSYLTADPSTPDSDLSNHFKLVFHLPMALLKDLGEYYRQIPRDHAVRTFIDKVLTRDVENPLRELIGYYKGVLALGAPIFDDTELFIADYNTDFDDVDPRIQLPTVVTERIAESTPLSAFPLDASFIATIAPTGWSDLYNSIAANSNPYQDGGNFYDQIYDALNYNLLANSLDRLLQAVERIAREVEKHFLNSLVNSEEHTPHYALWLTFLQLFKFGQDHLNTLTERHLNYYYKDILRFCLRAAEPDKVHLLFELNKTTEEHLLPAESTTFKAGKDDLGREVNYRLDSDFVVNRAQVDSLKSLYRPTTEWDGKDVITPHASAVTNSRDGEGEELPKDNLQWRPFGPEDAPAASIGFAIADRSLFLREGQRTITVTAYGNVPVTTHLPTVFKIFLTGEEGWLPITDGAMIDVRATQNETLVFEITLDGEDPAIVPHDPAIHGDGYPSGEPMIRIEFDFSQPSEWFARLRNIRFDSIEISTSAQDVRNFTLQNEAGILDTTKPFTPFGVAPAVDSPLILGSSELFSKKLDEMTLAVQWDKILDATGFFVKAGPSDYKARLRHLKEGAWKGGGNPYDIELFADGNQSKEIDLDDLSDLSDSVRQTLENKPFSNNSTAGFIRLELSNGFGHGKYPNELTKALILLAGGTDQTSQTTYNYLNGLPLEPYTPRISEISIAYTTVPDAPNSIYHVYPFGQTKESESSGRLFPELPNEGELYIGVKDLDPPQRLAMLFQTVDGTANPLKLENSLSWDYLRDNTWEKLDSQFVDDKTDNLTGSGIVGLAVPEDANTSHTLMPSGLHWFRMSVEKDSDALNNLLSIDAQAASATFADNGNDPAFVAKPLDGGTISKLKISDAAIKKIRQPYASFGGKAEETSEHFYVRASERLRHKDRASTMWDYERLVLEHFPKIYKVKCINHTELCRDLDNNIMADNEVKPGHVLVVTIPYVKGEGAGDPLRPYTDKKTLGAIDEFLRQWLSPFVQLEVQNPKIEEVQVKFKIAFHDEIADISFYTEELKQAIIRFLSPWANDDGGEISFGGKWHKSTIINFVEEQPYVDYIKDFEMYHKPDIAQSDVMWNRIDEETVEATTSRSILVSHSTHIIDEIGKTS